MYSILNIDHWQKIVLQLRTPWTLFYMFKNRKLQFLFFSFFHLCANSLGKTIKQIYHLIQTIKRLIFSAVVRKYISLIYEQIETNLTNWVGGTVVSNTILL